MSVCGAGSWSSSLWRPGAAFFVRGARREGTTAKRLQIAEILTISIGFLPVSHPCVALQYNAPTQTMMVAHKRADNTWRRAETITFRSEGANDSAQARRRAMERGGEATMPGRGGNWAAGDHHGARRKRAADRPEILLVRDGSRLTLGEVVAVARANTPVHLSAGAVERIRAARAIVEGIEEEGRQVYGVTTGFGHLSRVAIPRDQLAALQRNLIRSHASGVGEPFDVPTTRAVTLLLANSLSRGHSGARVELVKLLLDMLNAGVAPIVPKRSSVGASGDLSSPGASEPGPHRRGGGGVRW